jgi:hypothetical protein
MGFALSTTRPLRAARAVKVPEGRGGRNVAEAPPRRRDPAQKGKVWRHGTPWVGPAPPLRCMCMPCLSRARYRYRNRMLAACRRPGPH